MLRAPPHTKDTKGNRQSSKTHAITEDTNNIGTISNITAATFLLFFSPLGEVKAVGKTAGLCMQTMEEVSVVLGQNVCKNEQFLYFPVEEE